MNSLKSLVTQLRSLQPRLPSAALRRRLFGARLAPPRGSAHWSRIILPLGATAFGSLALTLWTARDFPGTLGARGAGPEWVVAATGTTWAASLPGVWHSRRNPAPTRLDWTNAGPFFSSMGPLAWSSTNQLR